MKRYVITELKSGGYLLETYVNGEKLDTPALYASNMQHLLDLLCVIDHGSLYAEDKAS